MIRFAALPAAGKSERMGRPKLTLPVGGRPVIGLVLDALRAGGVGRCVVVTAPGSDELAAAARAAGADVVRLAEQTPDMRATLAHALAWAEAALAPAPDDFWLLVPADHPTLEAGLVRALAAAVADHPECSIALPVHAGRRGHPTLLRWRHAAGIRAWPAGQGVNRYLRQFPAETLEVPVASSEVCADLDTPEDYARLLARRAPNGSD